MDEIIQVQTTVGSREEGQRIGRALVDARLVACAQILGPVSSTYRWRGTIETAEEWLILLKAHRADEEALQAALRSLHPYDEPEIIALPVVAGSPGYLDWVRAETTREEAEVGRDRAETTREEAEVGRDRRRPRGAGAGSA